MSTSPLVRRAFLVVGALAALVPAVHHASGQVLEIPHVNKVQDEFQRQPQVFLRGGWGSAPGQFGKVDEASRPGPMDFAVTADALYVLDPVNARVQVFDLQGDFRLQVPVGTRTADFISVDRSGSIIVLDAFVRREFKTFSPAGEVRVHAKLPASIGLPSAVFADGQRLWIEERHNRVFEITADDPKAGARSRVVEALPGRPAGDGGRTLHAARKGLRDAVIRFGAGEKHGNPHQGDDALTVRFPERVGSIVALETDARGGVYIAAVCLPERGGDNSNGYILLAGITSDRTIAGAVSMPNAYVTDHYRKLCVSDSGDVIQMQTAEQEVRFVRWALRLPQKGEDTR